MIRFHSSGSGNGVSPLISLQQYERLININKEDQHMRNSTKSTGMFESIKW